MNVEAYACFQQGCDLRDDLEGLPFCLNSATLSVVANLASLAPRTAPQTQQKMYCVSWLSLNKLFSCTLPLTKAALRVCCRANAMLDL